MTDRLTTLERDLDATRALLERDGRKVLVVAVILDGPTGTIAHSVSQDTTCGDGLFFAGCLDERVRFLKSRSGGV